MASAALPSGRSGGGAAASAAPVDAQRGSGTTGNQEPLTGFALGITAVALALGTFMQVLDSTIANVSLNTIAGNLGVSQDSSTWVITAFACANGVTVPLTGWLMRRFGVVRTFMFSVALFTITSLLCGLAWSLPSLIVFRLLQGACSGPMIPGSQALLIAVFPAEKRSAALGLWSMTTLVGPVAGPILGGYISDNFHWGWIFLINVPFGIFVVLVCWRMLLHRDAPGMRLSIDFVGLILLMLWVGSLQVFLDLGKNADWFNSAFITSLAIIAAIAFVAWIIWEATEERPIVDLSLFLNRNFALGTLAIGLGFGSLFGNLVLFPLWLQTQLGYTATWAGLVSAPSGVVAVVLTPFIARIAKWADARILATLSFLAFAISYWMRAHFTTDVDPHALIMPIMVQGVAMSMFLLSIIAISLDGVTPEKVPSASGISNFVRITTGSFFASLITTVWDRREVLHQTHLSGATTPGAMQLAQSLQSMQAAGTPTQQTVAGLSRQLVQQSYLLAFDDISQISALICLALLVIVWFTRRPGAPTGPIAAD
jgi:DHA2 family multidrug resistance protein